MSLGFKFDIVFLILLKVLVIRIFLLINKDLFGFYTEEESAPKVVTIVYRKEINNFVFFPGEEFFMLGFWNLNRIC